MFKSTCHSKSRNDDYDNDKWGGYGGDHKYEKCDDKYGKNDKWDDCDDKYGKYDDCWDDKYGKCDDYGKNDKWDDDKWGCHDDKYSHYNS